VVEYVYLKIFRGDAGLSFGGGIMKKALSLWLTLILLTSTLIIAQQNTNQALAQDILHCYWQNPLPQGNTINDMYAIDANIAWAVGGSAILRTDDGGANWSLQNSNTTHGLSSVSAANRDIAWSVGGDGTVLKTINGGKNWFAQDSNTASSLTSVSAVNETTAWIAGGSEATILKTTDGGHNWNIQLVNSSLSDICAVDENIAWAVGGTSIYRTTDGGDTWEIKSSVASESLQAIAAVDATTAWAGGVRSTLIKTTDGGETWVSFDLGTANTFTDITAMSSDIVWAVRRYDVYRTLDGGLSWDRSFPEGDFLWALSAVDENVAWTAGNHGYINKTENGGEEWISQDTAVTRRQLHDISAADSFHAWAVGGGHGWGGTIVKTYNGGMSWELQDSGISNRDGLVGVSAIDSHTAWAVGYNDSSYTGIILKTSDGTTWNNHTPGTIDSLYDVEGTSSNIAWAVGDNGTILKTTDGVNWHVQSSNTNKPLYGISAINSYTAWAVGYDSSGEHSVILNTTDGDNWNTQISDYPGRITSISAVDSQIVWAAGSSGVLKTMDGGLTWVEVPTPSCEASIDAVDENIAWVIFGGFGMARTIDGGLSWTICSTGITDMLSSISAIDRDNAWAAGAYGAIIRSGMNELEILVRGNDERFFGSVEALEDSVYRLRIQNNLYLWYSILKRAQYGATIESDSPYSIIDMIPPEEYVSYFGSFTCGDQLASFTCELNERALKLNFAQVILYFLPGATCSPGAINYFVEHSSEIPDVVDCIKRLAEADKYIYQGYYKLAWSKVLEAGKCFLRLCSNAAELKEFTRLLEELTTNIIGEEGVSAIVDQYNVVNFAYVLWYFYSLLVESNAEGYGNIQFEAVETSKATTLTQNMTSPTSSMEPLIAELEKEEGASTLGVNLEPSSGAKIGITAFLSATASPDDYIKHMDFEYSLNGTEWYIIGRDERPSPGLTRYSVIFDTSTITDDSIEVRVRGYDFEEVPGPYSYATYDIDHAPPSIPTNFSALSVPGGVLLQWDANCDPDLEGYNIYRASDATGPFELLDCTTIQSRDNPTTYRDTTAKEGAFYYRLTAFDDCLNESDTTLEVTASSLADEEDPYNLVLHPDCGTSFGSSVFLIGNAEDDGAITSVSFEYSQGGPFQNIGTADAHYDQDSGVFHAGINWDTSSLSEGLIDVRMIATDSGGHKSSIIGTYEIDMTPPNVPEGLSAIASSNKIDLSWDPVPGATSYVIISHDDTSSEYCFLDAVKGTSFTDDGLEDGKMYFYRVAAQDSANNRSDYSNEVSIKTLEIPNIISINPTSGEIGTILNISGTGFLSPQGLSYVSFGSKNAIEYSSWSDTEIICKVPSSITGNVQVTVTTEAGTSNWKIFKVVDMQAPEPSSLASTFYFAEGTTRPGFDPYLCIQNPGGTQADVTITYMLGNGTTSTQNLNVAPNSRSTIAVKAHLGEANDDAHDFSAKVETTNDTQIICERPLYFNYNGWCTGGHNVVGNIP